MEETTSTTVITSTISEGQVMGDPIPAQFVPQELIAAPIPTPTATLAETIVAQVKETAPEGKKTTEFYAMLITQGLIGLLVFKFAFLGGATSVLALVLLPVVSGIVTAIYTLVRYLIKREWLRGIVAKIHEIQEGANS